MAGAGGQEVGRVSIRVVPNTDGFREKVEREAAGLRDLEVDIRADLDTDKAKAEAEKFEKTTKPTVTADIDTAALKSKLKAATRELRETVRLAATLDTAGLKAQMARVRALARESLPIDLDANVDRFMHSVFRAKEVAEWHMSRIKAGLDSTRFMAAVVKAGRSAKGVLEAVMGRVSLPARVAVAPLVQSARAARSVVERVFAGLRVSAEWAGERMMPAVVKTRNAIAGVLRGVRATAEWHAGPIIRQAAITRDRLQDIFSAVRADVELVSTPLLAAARAAKAKAEAVMRGIHARVTARMDVDGAGVVAKARAYAAAASKGLRIRAKMDVDRRALASTMRGMQKSLRFLSRPFYKTFGGQVFQDVILNFTRMKGVIASVTFAASALLVPIAAVGNAAASAAASMVKLFGGMLPAALGAAALGIAGIAKAFSGFGDVVKATNLSELEAALEGLGPAAQKGARGIYDIKTAFKEASEAAQENFWSGITESFNGLTRMAGMAGAAVADISTEAGKAANGLLEFTNTASGMRIFSQLLDEASRSASNIAKSTFNMVPGLMAVGAVAGRVFADLTEKLDNSLSGWSDRMVREFESGALQQTIDKQVSEVQAFFSTLGDIGAIIGGVWNAAAASGERFLVPLRETIAKTREWVESSEGINTMRGYFDQMAGVIESLVPIFQEIAQTILGTVVPAMAGFINAAGPGMQAFAQGFAEVIGQLSGFAEPLGAAFGAVVGHVGQLLPAIAPLIPVVVGLWGAFEGGIRVAPILSGIGTALGAVSAPMMLVAAGVAALAIGIAGVPGATERLGAAFQGLLGALAPVGSMLMELGMHIWSSLQPAFAALVPVIETLINTVTQIVTALIPVIQSLVSVLMSIVSAAAPVLTIILQVAAAFATLLLNIVAFVAEGLAHILSFVAGVIAGFASMASSVIATVAGWVSGILSFIGGMVSGAASLVSSMWSQTVSAFTSGVASAVSVVASMPGRVKSALGNVGGLLVASGKALIQGFINGIKSMIGAVAGAAKSVVSAARSFFPFSPAKKGPFSGRGYTTYSGKALVKDFAGGMTSQISGVRNAANDVVSAVNGEFERFHHNQVLQPVLESNAKKIHDSRKRERDEEKKHQERLAKIDADYAKRKGEIAGNKSKDAKKQEQYSKALKSNNKKIAEENKKHAENMAKIRKELDESLEAPDYSDINRSFKAFYVEGAKGILQEQLMGVVESQKLSAQARGAALQAVAEARKVIGNHPVLADVEYNVKSDHFDYAFKKAIEESNIAAVPVEFVISNLDQLKSDLGMGDGVISRAIDQAAEWNWNNTDAKRFRDDKPYEVHYHVEDMQEAIRREDLRVRKQMMKLG